MTTTRYPTTSITRRAGRCRALLAAAVTIGTLALCSCGVSGGSSGGGSDPTVTTKGQGGSDQPGVQDFEGNDKDFPRSISYGVLDVEVTDLVISKTNPSETATSTPDDPEVDYIGLDTTVTNTWKRGNLSVPAGVFQLRADEGAPIPGFTEDNLSLELTGGRSVDTRLWYEVPADADLSNGALVIQEARNGTYYEPAVLPLLGKVNPEQRAEVAITPTDVFDEKIQVGVEIGSEPGWVDFDIALDEKGDLGAGGSNGWASALGRAPEGHAFLHIPGQAEGTPVYPVPLSFNGVNYGIPALATAEGANNPVATTFPDLDGRFDGEFAVNLNEGAESLEFRIGCPCGGLLTGNTIEREILSVVVDVSAVDGLRHTI